MIRIVSLNCWGGRIQGLIQYLQEIDADVLCLQEIYSAPGSVPSSLTFTYKHRPGQTEPCNPKLFDDLRIALPDHQAFFNPTLQGDLYDESLTGYKAKFGIATFIRNNLPIIAQAAGFVYGGYRNNGWGEPPLPSNAHCIRLWRQDIEKPIVIAHMHGIWVQSGKADTHERAVQAIRLADIIKSVRYPDDDTVVCGDFNVLPQSTTFETFREIGLQDLVVGYGHTDTRTSYYKKHPRYADYMLVSEGVQVDRFDVPDAPEVSDHRALILECE